MDKLVYYSQNSMLAYKINKLYYGDKHYVWCCDKPFYTAAEKQPMSSNPIARCEIFLSEISTNDGHPHWIKENKDGIKRGAAEQCKNKVITEDERNEIIAYVNSARIEEFYPCLYVIPYEKIESLIEPVEVGKKASKTSNEFLIKALPRECFDLIDVNKIIPSVLRGVGEET